MIMKVVVHAGMHKTATTALQHCLYANRYLLAENGINYPDGGLAHQGKFHQGLLLNTRLRGWSPKRLADILKSARSSKQEQVLLSAESVSLLSTEQIQKVLQAFPDVDFKFVLCFRHWKSFLPSRWAQNCRARDSQTFCQYFFMISNEFAAHPDCRFDKTLSRFSKIEGTETTAVSYDNAMTNPKGVLNSLLISLGISPSIVAKFAHTKIKKNRRSQASRTELSRLLNGVLADHLQLPQNELCNSIGEFRHVDMHFRTTKKMKKLDTVLLSELEEVVDQYEMKDDKVVLPDWIEDIEQEMENHHGDQFANLIDGKVFAQPVKPRIKYIECEWQDFRSENAALVNAAVNALAPLVRAS